MLNLNYALKAGGDIKPHAKKMEAALAAIPDNHPDATKLRTLTEQVRATAGLSAPATPIAPVAPKTSGPLPLTAGGLPKTDNPAHDFEAATRNHIEAVQKAATTMQRNAAMENLKAAVSQHMLKHRGTKTATLYDTPNAEQVHTINFHGLPITYGADRHDHTAELLSRMLVKPPPPALMKVTRRLHITSQANKSEQVKADAIGMKGGQIAGIASSKGDMALYRNFSAQRHEGVFHHEAGHALARHIWGNMTPPPSSEYRKIIQTSGEDPVTPYAATSPAEDFAEAVRVYIQKPEEMKQYYPKRYAAIHKLVTSHA